jgi:hypothetical protein
MSVDGERDVAWWDRRDRGTTPLVQSAALGLAPGESYEGTKNGKKVTHRHNGTKFASRPAARSADADGCRLEASKGPRSRTSVPTGILVARSRATPRGGQETTGAVEEEWCGRRGEQNGSVRKSETRHHLSQDFWCAERETGRSVGVGNEFPEALRERAWRRHGIGLSLARALWNDITEESYGVRGERAGRSALSRSQRWFGVRVNTYFCGERTWTAIAVVQVPRQSPRSPSRTECVARNWCGRRGVVVR